MKNKFIILIGLFIFFSCEKEESTESFTYEGIFQANRYENFNARLFTMDGEVYDQNIILDYIENNNIDFVIDDINTMTEINEVVQIEFVSEQNVNFTTDNVIENRELYEIDEYLYLESSDTTYYSNPLNQPKPNHFDLLKHSSLYKNQNTIPPNVLTHHKHCYYIKAENKTIKMPILGYYIHNFIEEGPQLISSSIWNFNNEFNYDVLNHLQENDFILIQERNLIFEKQ